VVAYIFFGQALYAVGGDKFLTDLAMAAAGRYRGGPAKMAVVSSSLYGMVSGSAVANVVVDGAITIPMMKRSGYPAHLAAAIEAVSSNGGQIMPPVMGAAAFLIAEYLAIPYGEVALEGTGRTMLALVAITTLAGIVIGAFQLSGLTSKLPLLLVSTAGGNVFLLLVLTAVVSIFLGMSLPTTVVYITLAVLVGPALAQLGIVPLAARLFLTYFGMLSLITPPDCFATNAA